MYANDLLAVLQAELGNGTQIMVVENRFPSCTITSAEFGALVRATLVARALRARVGAPSPLQASSCLRFFPSLLLFFVPLPVNLNFS